MAKKARPEDVLSHWYMSVPNFETSGLEFYAQVEEAVGRRMIPESSVSRIDYTERGLLTARREYLRVQREKLVFDVCAAPFGNGYFFSWWLAELRPSPLLGCIGLFGLLFVSVLAAQVVFWIVSRGGFLLSMVIGVPASVAAFIIVFWFALQSLRQQTINWDDSVRAIPVLGWVYERLFGAETYYSIDTKLMFQEAVRGSVMEVIDGLTQTKGLRALTDEERKPIMRRLAK